MECKGTFSLASLRLEKLSAITLALHLWERPDVKIRMDDDFTQRVKRYNELDDYGTCSLCHPASPNKFYCKLGDAEINYTVQQLNLLNYPEKLVREIIIAVAKIWLKMCYWKYYVIKTLGLDRKYAGKIYFTSHGEVDQIRILEEFWLNDAEFPSNSSWRADFRENHVFCTAVVIFGKDAVVSAKFVDLINELLKAKPAEKITPFEIIKNWFTLFANKYSIEYREEKEEISQILNDLEERSDQIGVDDLLFPCVMFHYEFGFKYLWSKLSDIEKDNLVIKCAEKCVVKIVNTFEFKNFYASDGRYVTKWLFKEDSFHAIKIESLLKILLFLINEMTEFQRIDFIPQNFIAIFKSLCIIWPYQELCPDVLYAIWQHIPIPEVELLELVLINYVKPKKPQESEGLSSYYSDKSETLNLRYNLTFKFATQNFFHRLLNTVMSIISKESKEKVFVDDNFENLKCFYEMGDFVSLNIIINDRHLVDHKKEMLEIGDQYTKEFIFIGDHESVNKLFEIMEFTREEKKSIQKKLNLLDHFLISGNVKLADKHLMWLLDSDAERDELKNKTDAAKICYLLIQSDQYEKADKFLKWRFNTEEERRNVKKKLKSDDAIVKKIFRIWTTDLECKSSWRITSDLDSSEKATEICSLLLKWFLESDMEIAYYKKTKLKALNEDLVAKYWYASSGDRSFKNFDKFLGFCLFSTEEIVAMQKSIEDNINWWIDTYALERNNFEIIDDLLRWVYGNDEEKRDDVIRNYMSFPQGALVFIKLFKNFTQKSKDRILKFFNSWIEISSNYSEIKSYLEALRNNETRLDVSRIKHLLVKKENGEFFAKDDFDRHFDLDRYRYYDDESDNEIDE